MARLRSSRPAQLGLLLIIASATAVLGIAACEDQVVTSVVAGDGGTTTRPRKDSGDLVDPYVPPDEIPGEDSGADSGGKDAGKDSGIACTADDGPALDCAGAKCASQCATAKSYWKKAVANDIRGCLDRLASDGGSSACSTAASPCVAEAAQNACDDTGAAAFCTMGFRDGGGPEVTQGQCVHLVRATNTDGRDALSTCREDFNADTCLTILTKLND